MFLATFYASDDLPAAFLGVSEFTAFGTSSRSVDVHKNTMMLLPKFHRIWKRSAKHGNQDSVSGRTVIIAVFQESPYFISMEAVFFKLLFDIFQSR